MENVEVRARNVQQQGVVQPPAQANMTYAVQANVIHPAQPNVTYAVQANVTNPVQANETDPVQANVTYPPVKPSVSTPSWFGTMVLVCKTTCSLMRCK